MNENTQCWNNRRIIIIVFLSSLIMACSSKTVVESDLGISDAPDWVNEGTNVLKNDNERLFHGVGSAPPLGDQSLQTSTADDRARAEIAKILNSYMKVISKDYMDSGKFGEDTIAVEQTVSRNIENITKLNMTGVRIIGRWKQEENNVIYSIAELNMSHVKTTMNQIETMNPEFRHHFSHHSDRLFDGRIKGVK